MTSVPLPNDDAAETGKTLPAWTSAERESFFDAIARHRRAAWRVTLVSVLVNTAVALVVSILMAPLFYALLALAFDLVNLVHRAPNLIPAIMATIDPLVNAPERVPTHQWLYVAFLAALPGLLWMSVVLMMLQRALRLSDTFSAGELAARAPDPQVLAEQRFKNVIEEMALAANLPAPRVLVIDSVGLNAAVFGRDEQHASVIVSQGLLSELNRAEMQGVAAHLIGSIANGDMSIGLRAATTLSLFGLLGRFTGLLADTSAWRPLARIFLTMLRPTVAGARQLAADLADPFQDTAAKGGRVSKRTDSKSENDWRMLLRMPLAGPIVMTGFLAGVVDLFALHPLVALAWRRRKYMADATAVRLTRDPDTLAGALQKMSFSMTGTAFAQWAAHFCVTAPPVVRGSGLLNSSFVPMFPSLHRRLRALQKMGARITELPFRYRMPLWGMLILTPLFAALAVLVPLLVVMLAYVSIPLSTLFLGIPFSIVHLLLRWLRG
jgi:Zn-dependent protease with chaperone function